MVQAVRAALAEVFGQVGRPVPVLGQPLDLDSLMVVALVDALEAGLPVRLRPQDVTAAHFSSRESLERLCRTLLAAG